MEKLFERLANEGLLKDWAPLLDWLFDENRFQNWSPGYIGSLTKKIKRLPRIGNDTYFYDQAKNLDFPNEHPKHILIMMTKGDSEARDLIRHIRNGVAHGRTNLIHQKDGWYIEIIDYSKPQSQSAYLYMPIDYINQIYGFYQDVKKKSNHKNK